MDATYHAALAAHGAGLVTHVFLVNSSGAAVSDRLAASWTTTGGRNALSANRVFDVASGAEVAGWRGASAATGGTVYGGKALPPKTFANPGQYTLNAGDTFIDHVAGA